MNPVNCTTLHPNRIHKALAFEHKTDEKKSLTGPCFAHDIHADAATEYPGGKSPWEMVAEESSVCSSKAARLVHRSKAKMEPKKDKTTPFETTCPDDPLT